MIYLATFIFIFYGWVLVDLKNCIKLAPLYIALITIVLILITGLRYRVGGDSLHYIDTYSSMPTLYNLKDIDYSEGYSPLWYVFTAISKTLSPDFVCLQLLHAVIVNITFLYVFWKKSRKIISCFLVYFLIYYIYFGMEILREALAVCVFCFNIHNLIEKKYFKYYLFCLLSIGFHFSALILLFFPLLYNLSKSKRANRYLGFVGLFTLLIFFYFIPTYYTLLMDYIPIVAMKLQSYSTLSLNNILGLFYYSFPFWIFLGIYSIATRNKLFAPEDNCIMRLLLLFLLLGAINQGLMRLANYLIPFAIPYVVNTGYFLFKSSKLANHKLIFVSCIMLLLFQKAYYYWNDTSDLAADTRRYELWYPYESVLYPVRHHNRELIYYNAMLNQSILRGGGE